MSAVSGILAIDIRRRMRSPVSIILMMLIPVTMTIIIGLVFGRSGEVTFPKIRVLLVDRDGGFMSGFLRQGMQQGELGDMLDITEVEPAEGEGMMSEGKASALIEIPRGFTSSVLDGETAEIRVLKNPSEYFLPLVVEEVARTMAVILDGGRRIFSDPIARMRSFVEGDRWPASGDMEKVFEGARNGMILASGYLADSLITYTEETAVDEDGEESGASGFNIFAYVMPGSMMIGLLFIVELVLRDILREKNSGTLSRILASPVRTGEVVAGKVGAAFAITMISCVILLAVSRIGFSVKLGDPAALLLHTVGTILMCTGVMTLLYGAISSERAADAVMSVVIIIMALFGGSMVPFEQMPALLQSVGRFSPVYWASDGFKMIFLFDASTAGVALHLLVLYALGAATLIPGAFLIRSRISRGGWAG
jgi:ABC-2 type transport system permease protein